MALTGSNAMANAWTISAGSAAYFNGANAIQLTASTSLPAGSESIHVTNAAGNVTLSGLISGPGALVRASDAAGQFNGTVVINNPLNTFSGGFTLQSLGGIIDVQGASTVLSGTNIVSGPLGTGTITIGSANTGYINLENSSSTAVTLANPMNIYDGSTYSSSAGLTFTGPVTLTGPGTNGVIDFWPAASSNIAFTGVISGGTKGVNVRSSGNLTLSGSNTYTGATSITMGTLIAGRQCPQRQPRRVRQRHQRNHHRRRQFRRHGRGLGHQWALRDRPPDHRQFHGRPHDPGHHRQRHSRSLPARSR